MSINNLGMFARPEHKSGFLLRRYRICFDCTGNFFVTQYDDPNGPERRVGSNGFRGRLNPRKQEITVDAPTDEAAMRIARLEARAYSQVAG